MNERSESIDKVGAPVTHRRYVPYAHAHYAGNLVDGAYALGLFGDVATEVCIRTDGDEGLFASYQDVQFKAPIRAGDVVEVTATVTRMGTRSRTIDFTCAVVCRGTGGSAAEVLGDPIVAVTATGTVVIP
jgi:3-aminobutyryl-CoA ammonia-lyase